MVPEIRAVEKSHAVSELEEGHGFGEHSVSTVTHEVVHVGLQHVAGDADDDGRAS